MDDTVQRIRDLLDQFVVRDGEHITVTDHMFLDFEFFKKLFEILDAAGD